LRNANNCYLLARRLGDDASAAEGSPVRVRLTLSPEGTARRRWS